MYFIDHGVLIAFLAGRPIGLIQQSSRGVPTLCQKSICTNVFFFLKPAGPTNVLKDRDATALAAHVVPYKGGDLEWAVKQAGRDLIKLGIRGGVFLKCDREEALEDFVNDLTKLRNASPGVRTIVKHSLVRESQSNGFIEGGVKTVEGMVRTIKLNLEQRLHECIEVDHPIFCWLMEHAADVSKKFRKGVDGKTAYERLTGKPYRGEILEFGCQDRVPGNTQGGLLAARWHTGVWLGKRFASDEHLVSMPDGRWSLLEQCQRSQSNRCGQRRLLTG